MYHFLRHDGHRIVRTRCGLEVPKKVERVLPSWAGTDRFLEAIDVRRREDRHDGERYAPHVHHGV